VSAAFLLAGVLAPVRPDVDRGVTTDPAQPAFIDEAILFAFDNMSIAATDNLALTMHPPEKHPGNPVGRDSRTSATRPTSGTAR
jgi:hypothetical protein